MNNFLNPNPYGMTGGRGLMGMGANFLLGQAGLDVMYHGNTNYYDHVLNQQYQTMQSNLFQESIRYDLMQGAANTQTAMANLGMPLSGEGQTALNSLASGPMAAGISMAAQFAPEQALQVADTLQGGVSASSLALGLGYVNRDRTDPITGRGYTPEANFALAQALQTQMMDPAANMGFSGRDMAGMMAQMHRRAELPGTMDPTTLLGLQGVSGLGAETQQALDMLSDRGITAEEIAFARQNPDSARAQVVRDSVQNLDTGRIAERLKGRTAALSAARDILEDDGINANLDEMMRVLEDLAGDSMQHMGGAQVGNMMRRMDRAADAIGYTTAELGAAAQAGQRMASAVGYEAPMGMIATTTMLDARQAFGNMGINSYQLYGMANADQQAQAAALGRFNAQESNEGQMMAAMFRMSELDGVSVDTTTADGRMVQAYLSGAQTGELTADGRRFANLSRQEQVAMFSRATGLSQQEVQQQTMNRQANEEAFALNPMLGEAIDTERSLATREAVGNTMGNAMIATGRRLGMSGAQARQFGRDYNEFMMSEDFDPELFGTGEYNRKAAAELADKYGITQDEAFQMIEMGVANYRGRDGGRYADVVIREGARGRAAQRETRVRNKTLADLDAVAAGQFSGGVSGFMQSLTADGGTIEGALGAALGIDISGDQAKSLLEGLEQMEAEQSNYTDNVEALKEEYAKGGLSKEEYNERLTKLKEERDSVLAPIQERIDGITGEATRRSEVETSGDKLIGENEDGSTTSTGDGVLDKVMDMFSNITGITLDIGTLNIDGKNRGAADGRGNGSASPKTSRSAAGSEGNRIQRMR